MGGRWHHLQKHFIPPSLGFLWEKYMKSGKQFPRFCCWTLIWLSRHRAWLRRGYWRYRSFDWLIDWLTLPLNSDINSSHTSNDYQSCIQEIFIQQKLLFLKSTMIFSHRWMTVGSQLWLCSTFCCLRYNRPHYSSELVWGEWEGTGLV